jgi:hypothetical protein
MTCTEGKFTTTPLDRYYAPTCGGMRRCHGKLFCPKPGTPSTEPQDAPSLASYRVNGDVATGYPEVVEEAIGKLVRPLESRNGEAA